VHPFYEPSARLVSDRRTASVGLVSMAAYLVFWAVAIPVALRMLRRAPATNGATRDAAVGILRERYARGEIELDEYRRRLRVLDGTGRPRGRPGAPGRDPGPSPRDGSGP
jgi:putative membrane protein